MWQRRLGPFGLLEDRGQGFSLHQLHGQEVFILRAADLGNAHDIRVVEQGGDARLVEKHVDEVGLRSQMGQDLLHHHQGLEPGQLALTGQVHLGHTTDGEAGKQLVAAEGHKFLNYRSRGRCRCVQSHSHWRQRRRGDDST